MLLKYCLVLFTIGKIVGLSYNLPKFCSDQDWIGDAITYKTGTQVQKGYQMNMFITSNNDIYTIETKPELADIQLNGEDYSKFMSNYRYDSGLAYSMFITDDQSIYLTDIGRIVKRTKEVDTWQHVVFTNDYCYEIFISRDDWLYCSMFYQHKIVKIHLSDTENRSIVVAGNETGIEGDTADMLDVPCGIFVDIDLNLYVADSGNHRIQLFRPGDLNGITVAGQRPSTSIIVLNNPTDVILDAENYLYIVDTDNHRIVQSTPTSIRCIAGCNGKGSTSNHLFQPFSLFFDVHGNLYVTDKENDRIQKFIKNNNCGMSIDSKLDQIFFLRYFLHRKRNNFIDFDTN